MNRRVFLIQGMMWTGMLLSCQEEFLNVKSDMSIAAPSKIADYQALLDNSFAVMNMASPRSLNIIGGEEYTVESATWHGLPTTNNRKQQKNAYVWLPEIYEGEQGEDWNIAYQRILHANLASDGLLRLNPSVHDQDAWNNAYGSALFFRAWNYYTLAQTFCEPYDIKTSSIDLGLPLRSEADPTIKVARANLQDTYDFMLKDLQEAVNLLPNKPAVKMRYSKVAAYGLMARVYLQMGEVEEALACASKAIEIHDVLLDFNNLDTTKSYPFDYDYGEGNAEIIFHTWTNAFTILSSSRMNVANELLDLYAPGDLRRPVYYREGTSGNVFFRGSLAGLTTCFTGISTSEILLARAECWARLGDDDLAWQDIERLGKYRYRGGEFTVTKDAVQDILQYILDERRRELAFRGIRWEDLRRLNKEPRFEKTVTREIDGHVYRLEPRSSRYVWPIPDNVIQMSRIPQNIR